VILYISRIEKYEGREEKIRKRDIKYIESAMAFNPDHPDHFQCGSVMSICPRRW